MSKLVVMPYKYEHIVMMGDAAGEILIPPTTAVQLERQPSYTGMTPDGDIVGCAGVVKMWKQRWICWAHVSEKLIGEYKFPVVKEIRRFLSGLGPGRVEATVDAMRPDHGRFATACGFTRLETPHPMKRFLPNGNDAYLLARVVD